jgi:hypothetical protein
MADSGVIGTYEGEDGQVIEYCGIIQNIIKLDYRRFDVYVSDGLKMLWARFHNVLSR